MDRFMSVAFDPKSFEEIRIDDYIRAYTTTGRPPAALPPDSASRKRAGLPPLFEPLLEPAAPAPAPAVPPIRVLPALPATQQFTPTNIDSESFHTLTAMPLYRSFSLEELRVSAYLRGNKHPPTPIAPVPFLIAPAPAPAPVFAHAHAPTADPACTDQLLTISAQPEYAAHSLEELRVAAMQAGAGRDLSSAEIRARAPAPAPRVPAKNTFGTAAYPFTPGYRG